MNAAPTINLSVLVAAADALRMVKDLPVGAALNKSQWRDVMYAANQLSVYVEQITDRVQVEVTPS